MQFTKILGTVGIAVAKFATFIEGTTAGGTTSESGNAKFIANGHCVF
jgi:hypothetical protein